MSEVLVKKKNRDSNIELLRIIMMIIRLSRFHSILQCLLQIMPRSILTDTESLNVHQKHPLHLLRRQRIR